MVRVRCPSCGTIFEPSDAPTTCPNCGFDPARGTPSPTATTAGSRARAAVWFHGRRLVVLLATAAALLIAAAVGFYVLSTLGSGTALTEDDLEVALGELRLLPGTTDRPWGLDGVYTTPTAGSGNVTYDFTILSDGPDEAFLLEVKGGPNATQVDYLRAQKGKVINYRTPMGGLLARDEDPRTIERFVEQLPASGGGAFRVADMDVVTRDLTSERGAPTTKFSGTNGTSQIQVWVRNSDHAVTKFISVAPREGRFEVRVLYGDEVEVSVDPDLPSRASFQIKKAETFASCPGSRPCWHGVLTDEHTEEVRLQEVEIRLRAGSPEETRASMRLDLGRSTSGDHTISYVDADGDGLVSTGDTYDVSAPAGESVTIQFYDLWADAPAGGPTPFPGWAILVAAAAALAIKRRREP